MPGVQCNVFASGPVGAARRDGRTVADGWATCHTPRPRETGRYAGNNPKSQGRPFVFITSLQTQLETLAHHKERVEGAMCPAM